MSLVRRPAAVTAGAHQPNTSSMTLLRWAAVVLGFAFGLYFVLTSPFRAYRLLWLVWALLVVAFTAAAGVVFTYGIARWDELSVTLKVRVSARTAATRVIPIGLILLVLVCSPLLPESVGLDWRHAGLIATPLVGGITAAWAMEGIRLAAGDKPTGTRGEQAALLVRLRRLLQRLLGALGSLVALSTLALGASVNLERKLNENPKFIVNVLPPQFVLVFGGLGSLLVALYYVPASTALQRRGRQLCDDLFPLAEADEAAPLLARAEDHRKLEQVLGVDRGVAADLETALVLLGPLLASAVAAFLSP